MDKNALRDFMKDQRKKICDRKEQERIVYQKIINLKIFNDSVVIALFKSREDEFNTDDLINYALKNKKIVLLPRIDQDNMFFLRIDDNTIYEESKFHVLEPIYEQEKIINQMDLIIVPGLAFDQKGSRLGYGKGYYDRFLKDKDTYKIGVCYDEQIVDLVPTNDHDVSLDMIVSKSLKKIIKSK